MDVVTRLSGVRPLTHLEIEIHPTPPGTDLRPMFAEAYAFVAHLLNHGYLVPEDIAIRRFRARPSEVGYVVIDIPIRAPHLIAKDVEARRLKSHVDSAIPRFFEGRRP